MKLKERLTEADRQELKRIAITAIYLVSFLLALLGVYIMCRIINWIYEYCTP